MDTPIINGLYNPVIFEYIDPNSQEPFPEVWRRICDFDDEIKDCYLVSNKGRVYNMYTRMILHSTLDKDGYQFIRLARKEKGTSYKTFKLHRLVMICFEYREDFRKFQVNHIDGIKLNNTEDNLEWCNDTENKRHGFNTGLYKSLQGENSRLSRISNETAIKICEALEMCLPYEEICEYANLDYEKDKRVVEHILKRETWRSISQNYNFSKEEYDKKLKSSTTIES